MKTLLNSLDVGSITNHYIHDARGWNEITLAQHAPNCARAHICVSSGAFAGEIAARAALDGFLNTARLSQYNGGCKNETATQNCSFCHCQVDKQCQTIASLLTHIPLDTVLQDGIFCSIT